MSTTKEPEYKLDLNGVPVIGQIILLPKEAKEEIRKLALANTPNCPSKAFGHPVICLGEPAGDGQIDIVVARSFHDTHLSEARKPHEHHRYLELLNKNTLLWVDSTRVLYYTDPSLTMPKNSYVTLERWHIPWRVCRQWRAYTAEGRYVVDKEPMKMLLAELQKADKSTRIKPKETDVKLDLAKLATGKNIFEILRPACSDKNARIGDVVEEDTDGDASEGSMIDDDHPGNGQGGVLRLGASVLDEKNDDGGPWKEVSYKKSGGLRKKT